jgi:hypothetical protein
MSRLTRRAFSTRVGPEGNRVLAVAGVAGDPEVGGLHHRHERRAA